MNVGNIRIHQWFITTHPEIFYHYIQYGDENTFDPIALNCSVDNYENIKDTYVKLTSLAVYNTNCLTKIPPKRSKLSLASAKEVAVNAIIGIPTLKKYKASISFEGNFLTSPFLQTQFPLIYKPADNGLTSSVNFDHK